MRVAWYMAAADHVSGPERERRKRMNILVDSAVNALDKSGQTGACANLLGSLVYLKNIQ